MRKRFNRAFFAMSATAAVTAGLGLGTGVASAETVVRAATPQCISTPNCVSPDVYNGNDTGAELVLTSPAFELGVAKQNSPVVVDEDDNTNASQDWQWVLQGTVASLFNGGENPSFGLTAYDNAAYGTDPVYSLEFTPDGSSSGYCVANLGNKLWLRRCTGMKWQMYIQTDTVTAFSSADGNFVLSVVQARATGHHQAVTAHDADQQLTAQPIGNNGRNSQDWDSGDAAPGSS